MGTAVSRPLRIHNLDTTLSLHRPGGEICFFLKLQLVGWVAALTSQTVGRGPGT
jgi:hypothetical protein